MRRKGCARFWLNFSIFILCRVKNLRGDELTINPVLIGSLLYVMWRLLLYFVFRFPHHWGGLLFLLLLLCLLLLLLLLLLLVSTYSIQIIGQSVVIGAAEPVPRADWRKIWKAGGGVFPLLCWPPPRKFTFLIGLSIFQLNGRLTAI